MAKKDIISQGVDKLDTIQLSNPMRFGIDISDYVSAVKSAISVCNPSRVRLYDIYEDILEDTHLTSVINKRKVRMSSVKFTFVDKGKNRIDEVADAIDAPWFIEFVEGCIDAKMFGFSCFQFGKDEEGWITCESISRKHIDPKKRIVKRQQYDQDGIPFDQFYSLLLIGNKDDIGLLSKAAPYVIYKRNSIGDWSQFAELFGMPIREYTYDASNDEARNRLLQDAMNQGSAAVYIHPTDTVLKIVESAGKSGSVDVYDKLTDRCNAELSKVILGNTLSTEEGSTGTQALGTVQKEGEDDIMKADRRFILNILNYELTDILEDLGFDLKGGKFICEETEDVDLQQQLNIVQGLYNMNLPISDDYLYEKFGVAPPTKEEKKKAEEDDQKKKDNQQKQEKEDDEVAENLTEEEKDKLSSKLLRFFGLAPRKEGAKRSQLDW